jgi:hypothetical protein
VRRLSRALELGLIFLACAAWTTAIAEAVQVIR